MYDFKERYLSAILADLPIDLKDELTEEFSQWVYWQKSQLEYYQLPSLQINFLSQIGFPKWAMECTFEVFDKKTIATILSNHQLDERYFPMGFDGAGHVVFIHKDSNHIYLCDHNNGNHLIFINASLEQLAQTLVLMNEFFIQKSPINPMLALADIDKHAIKDNAFWGGMLRQNIKND